MPCLACRFAFGLLLFSTAMIGADQWTWTTFGPQARYGITALALDPADACLYAGSDEGWLFKSADRGQTWQQLWQDGTFSPTPGYIQTIAANPHRRGEIYVQANGLFRSADAGNSWERVVEGPIAQGEGAQLVFDPLHSGVVYGLSGRVYKSSDSGAHWNDISPDLDIRVLAISPDDPALLLAGQASSIVGDQPETWSNTALYRSLDGGQSWSIADFPISTAHIIDISFDPFNPQTVYASGFHSGRQIGAIFKSVDGGQSWTSVFELAGGNIEDLAADPHRPGVVYAGSVRKVQEPGLFISVDYGETWTRIFSGGPMDIVVDPQVPGSVFAAMREGANGVFVFTALETKTAIEATTWGQLKRQIQPAVGVPVVP